MTSNETAAIKLFTNIGFKKIGEWKIKDNELEIEYCDDQYKNNKKSFSFSYAFTFENNKENEEKIIYVGQSISGCFNRFKGYILAKEENKLKSTNLKIKNKICEKLKDKNNEVNIYILEIENSKYKGLDINIHLGLEPALIKIAMKDDGCLNGKRFKKFASK
jgi:hypothetical protein